MTIQKRKPSGLPTWPITLLAGREGTGKSFTAAEASASPLVSGADWISFGEKDPDDYGTLPGVRFDIIDHDGTFRSVVDTILELNAQPVESEQPRLLVLDSGTRVWQLLGKDAQAAANAHAVAVARAHRRPEPTGNVDIGDFWKVAAEQWEELMLALKAHQGPVIVTARLEQVALLDDNGRPTGDRAWKVQAHKSLPYDANVIVEMVERGDYLLKKRMSAIAPLERPTTVTNFTMDALWRDLGLELGAGDRIYSEPVVTTPQPRTVSVRNWVEEAKNAPDARSIHMLHNQAKAAGAAQIIVDELAAMIDQRRKE